MGCDYSLVDVFTTTPFNGAQIAVFPNANNLSDAQMQRMAMEINQTESVFIQTPENGSVDLHVYTPSGRAGIGSHTTVAAATVLSQHNRIDGKQTGDVCFRQNDNILNVNVACADAGLQTQLEWQVHPTIDRYVPSATEMQGILSLGPNDIEVLKSTTLFVSCASPYLVVPLRSLQALYSARFNHEAWAQSSASSVPVSDILVFCRETENAQADFHLRLLGSDRATRDDPPVGAAVPAFAAFLQATQTLAAGRHTFWLERGRQAVRQSLLKVEFRHSESSALSVRIGGNAVVVAEGRMLLP